MFSLTPLMPLMSLPIEGDAAVGPDMSDRWPHLNAVAQLGQTALAGDDLETLMAAAVVQAAQALEIDICLLAEPASADNAEGLFRIRASVGSCPELIPGIGAEPLGATLEDFGPGSNPRPNLGATGGAGGDRLPIVAVASLLQASGTMSSLTVAIASGPVPYGFLVVYSRQPRLFSPEDRAFLQAIAHILAGAMARQRVEMDLRQMNEELELRVAERTAELMFVNQHLQLELEQHKRTQVALETSQKRFSGILSIADDAIIAIDGDHNITLFNQGAERTFGYRGDEILGKPLATLLPPRFVHAHDHHICTFKRSEATTRRMGERQEIYGRRKDGTEFAAEASIAKLDLETGPICTVILRDISDRKQIEKMKDEFVSIVSHELRTPLTSIHGSLGLLASGLLNANSEAGQRLLKIAVNSTDRLVRLINDILDIERIESGRVAMESQWCSVTDLITAAVNEIQGIADKAQIKLSISTTEAELQGDRDRIVQTLTNLISNAIKFSPVGSTISIKVIRNSQHIQFTIQDQGRGIPPEKLEMIFERFQQVDSSDSRNHEGTGLGLSICHSIVSHHGGTIWVDSILGQGSSFHFTLPLTRSPGS
jgi:PAS domain S-box-containing protein